MIRRFRHLRWSLVALLACLALAACSAASPGTNGGQSQAPSTGTGGGGGGGGGGGAASIDACKLASQSEVEAALGEAVDGGLLQTTDGQASCDWSGADGGVGISVQDYDADFWNTASNTQQATAVSGYGDAAFTGWPSAGTISIKQGAYEVDVGIENFNRTNEDDLAAAESLAKLVLPRI
jgi:Protein of unknown function (DUF3558)